MPSSRFPGPTPHNQLIIVMANSSIRFPDEVVITDVPADGVEGSATPASDSNDDFFSSWDKPSIKRPTPPVSRTGTPPVVGRANSPFLNPGVNGKDISRSTSPLSKSESTEAEAKPAASRVTHSAALRKTTAGGPRKANVLGAKKTTTKLGAKKITGDVIDFEEAERKAKEEAERIEKLGYNPEAEEVEAKKTTTTVKGEATNIVSPTPTNPRGYGSGHSREKSAAEVERLGMGLGRLGFGQVGGGKAAAPATAKKNSGGFGSVGPVKATGEGRTYTCFLWYLFFLSKFHTNTVQMTASVTPETSSATRKVSHPMSTLERDLLTLAPRLRPRRASRASREPRPSRPTLTSAVLRTKSPRMTMAISRPPPRTSSAGSGSLPGMTWKICQVRSGRGPVDCKAPSATISMAR